MSTPGQAVQPPLIREPKPTLPRHTLQTAPNGRGLQTVTSGSNPDVISTLIMLKCPCDSRGSFMRCRPRPTLHCTPRSRSPKVVRSRTSRSAASLPRTSRSCIASIRSVRQPTSATPCAKKRPGRARGSTGAFPCAVVSRTRHPMIRSRASATVLFGVAHWMAPGFRRQD